MVENQIDLEKIDFTRSVSISITLLEKIKNLVIEKLGLANKRYLNDKVDGIYYFNKVAKSFLSVYVVEKILGLELVQKKSLLNSETLFIFNKKKIQIIGIALDEDLHITKIEADLYIIVGLYDDLRKGKILGSISKKNLNQQLLKTNKSLHIMSKPSIVINKSHLNSLKNDLSK